MTSIWRAANLHKLAFPVSCICIECTVSQWNKKCTVMPIKSDWILHVLHTSNQFMMDRFHPAFFLVKYNLLPRNASHYRTEMACNQQHVNFR